MTNRIELFRIEMQNFFKESVFVEDSIEEKVSPCGKYIIQTSEFTTLKSWRITEIKLLEAETKVLLFQFLVNHSPSFYDWLYIHDTDYFICAEDIYGGQTIVDLTNKRIEGYSDGEDGFIWTDYSLSPNKKTLAVIGCFWAVDFEVMFYDFTSPLVLPLIPINYHQRYGEFDGVFLRNGSENFKRWIDDTHIELADDKGVTRIIDILNLAEWYD